MLPPLTDELKISQRFTELLYEYFVAMEIEETAIVNWTLHTSHVNRRKKAVNEIYKFLNLPEKFTDEMP